VFDTVSESLDGPGQTAFTCRYLSRNVKVLAKFRKRYRDRFAIVADYFKFKVSPVTLINASLLIPKLA